MSCYENICLMSYLLTAVIIIRTNYNAMRKLLMWVDVESRIIFGI
jgi:hypothetical protein